jgi:hypothetical protein
MANQAITIVAIHDLHVVFLLHTITQLHALVTVIPGGPYMMQKEKSHAATNCASPCLFADLPQLLIISDLITNSASCKSMCNFRDYIYTYNNYVKCFSHLAVSNFATLLGG